MTRDRPADRFRTHAKQARNCLADSLAGALSTRRSVSGVDDTAGCRICIDGSTRSSGAVAAVRQAQKSLSNGGHSIPRRGILSICRGIAITCLALPKSARHVRPRLL